MERVENLIRQFNGYFFLKFKLFNGFQRIFPFFLNFLLLLIVLNIYLKVEWSLKALKRKRTALVKIVSGNFNSNKKSGKSHAFENKEMY